MVIVAMLSMIALPATNAKLKNRWPLASVANDQRLSTSNFLQFLKKRRIRHSRSIRTVNRRLALCAQCSHGERHGNAVIAERIQFGAMQTLAPRNPQAIGSLFHFRAHFSQIGSDGRNAV